MTKQQLIHRLKLQGVFWNYQIDNELDLPDEIIIENTLRWADVPEILALFDIYPKEKIKQVWETSLIPDKNLLAHNYYLARVFFGIENANEFISERSKQNSRYERIKKLTAEN